MTVIEQLPGVGTVTETPTTVDPTTGDHDKFSHLVLEGFWPLDGDGERTGEFVASGNDTIGGVVGGVAVKALCGKVWVPSELGDRYPLCPMCKDIAKRHGWKVPA